MTKPGAYSITKLISTVLLWLLLPLQGFALNLSPAGTVQLGDSGSSLRAPTALLYDRQRGYFIVADTENNRVLIVDRSGGLVKHIGRQGELSLPVALGLTRKGDLLVAERNQAGLKRFPNYNSQGVFSYIPLQLDTAEPDHSLQPKSLFIDPQDRLYLVDRMNRKVLVYNSSYKLMTTLSGVGEPTDAIKLGQSLYISDAGFGGIRVFGPHGRQKQTLGAQSAQFPAPLRPLALVVDRRQRIWALDEQNALYALDKYGQLLFRSASDLFFHGVDLAIDEFDNLYVLEQGGNRIQVLKIQ